MSAIRILLERLVAENHSAEILTTEFPLPPKGCAIVKTMAMPTICQVHAVDDGAIVQIATIVKQIIATEDSGSVCREAKVTAGFFYSMYAPEGGHYEAVSELGEPEVFVQEGKTVVVIPCEVSLWYVMPELYPLESASEPDGEGPVLVDLVFAEGQERSLQHFPLSLAAASGFIRADLEANTTNTETLEGQALVSGMLTGGLYYAAPNETERWIELAKDFTFLIVNPVILPSMQVVVSYHLETRLSGQVLKVFIILDWLIIRKEAISLPTRSLCGSPIRVDRIVAQKQVPAQFKERFSLGEEVRKVRDYHLSWRSVDADFEKDIAMIRANFVLQVAGVTPLDELKEFIFSKEIDTVLAFPGLSPEVNLTAVPETQYLRVELLPRNFIGLLGQVTFALTATRRETVEVAPVRWEVEYNEAQEESSALYDIKLELPRGFRDLISIEVEPKVFSEGFSEGSTQVHGDLKATAVVQNQDGQTVSISHALPFWHFVGEGAVQAVLSKPPSVSMISQQILRETGWKGLVNKWFLRLTLKVVFTTKTLRRKTQG